MLSCFSGMRAVIEFWRISNVLPENRSTAEPFNGQITALTCCLFANACATLRAQDTTSRNTRRWIKFDWSYKRSKHEHPYDRPTVPCWPVIPSSQRISHERRLLCDNTWLGFRSPPFLVSSVSIPWVATGHSPSLALKFSDLTSSRRI